jgi:sec-independent protein translocase protein TatA
MFGIGTGELIIVGLIALLLFGNRLPSVMRSLGQGVNEFKKGLNDVQHEMENPTSTPPQELEKPTTPTEPANTPPTS